MTKESKNEIIITAFPNSKKLNEFLENEHNNIRVQKIASCNIVNAKYLLIYKYKW